MPYVATLKADASQFIETGGNSISARHRLMVSSSRSDLNEDAISSDDLCIEEVEDSCSGNDSNQGGNFQQEDTICAAVSGSSGNQDSSTSASNSANSHKFQAFKTQSFSTQQRSPKAIG